jgi:hypothetical protein
MSVGACPVAGSIERKRHVTTPVSRFKISENTDYAPSRPKIDLRHQFLNGRWNMNL